MATDNYNDYEGMDSGVNEDAFEQDPVLAQYQTEDEQDKWQKELEACRKERKNWNATATRAVARYRADAGAQYNGGKFYNIYFQNTDTKLAALYARTPKPDIKRRFDDSQDDAARVAGLLLQRNLEYELDTGGFDTTFKQVLFDHVVAGMGVSWLRYEQEEHQQAPAFDPTTGAVIPQPPVITCQEACTDYVAWDDFYWSPCKVWTMCSWVARRIPMTKEAMKHRFGHTVPAEMLSEVSYSNKPDAQEASKAKLAPKNQTEETADVYEIWDKERQLVFWVTDSIEVPLDVQQDTMDFEGFFPTPLPPLGRFDTANAMPVSDYQLVRGKYDELDELNQRCTALSQAMKVRFAYNAANPEISKLYTTVAENEGIAVKDWNSFTERGGLAGAIQFAPLDQIANAFNIANAQLERIKAQIYEVEGISDLMRGQAMPYETATATTAKSQQSFGRFAARQQAVAEYVEELMRLKAHVICKFYQPELIIKRAMPLNPADQQFIGPALQLLKDEQLNQFRLSVSVDSLQLPNWNTEKAERSEAIQAISKMLGAFMPLVQQMPEAAPLGLELFKFGVGGFKGAQSIEGAVDSQLQQLVQAKQQGGNALKQPSPDQVKAQAVMQKAQLDYQAVQMQESTKMQIAQLEAQLKQQQMALDQMQTERDNAIRQSQLVMRQGELAANVAHQQASHVHGAAIDLMNNRPNGGF